MTRTALFELKLDGFRALARTPGAASGGHRSWCWR